MPVQRGLHDLRSFVGVWHRRLRGVLQADDSRTAPPVPVPLTDDHRLPLYLQAEGGRLQLEGGRLRLVVGDQEVTTAPLADVSEVVLMGPVSITTPCLHALLRADVPVAWHAMSGWFLGHTVGLGTPRLARRLAQYRAHEHPDLALEFARTLVAAKIHGCRLMLRRNHKAALPPRLVLCRLDRLEDDASRAESLAGLLGIEGSAAAIYFAEFKAMLAGELGAAFAASFPGRRKRPPTDPLNAALSFAYALLTRATTVAVSLVGLDPQLGFLHASRAGRPALALDLMEPLRPLIADSIVLSLINNRRLNQDDFVVQDDAVLLDVLGRRRLIDAFERRLSQQIEHPAFARPLTYRAWLPAQARLLADRLTGVRADFPQLRPR